MKKYLYVTMAAIGMYSLGECMTADPSVELELRKVQSRMQTVSPSPSLVKIDEGVIRGNVRQSIAKDFYRVFEASLHGNPGMLDACLDMIYTGAWNSNPLFKAGITLDERIRYIKYIAIKTFSDWLAGSGDFGSAIVALKGLLTYCKDYAQEIELIPLNKRINTLYTEVQQQSSSDDE